MLAITTIEEAYQVWQEFKGKYAPLTEKYALKSNSSPLTPASAPDMETYLTKVRENFSLFKPKSRNISSLDNAAKLIQKSWYHYINSSLIPIKSRQRQSGEFRHLVHEQSIKKSLHPKKLKALKTALDQGNWNAPIFSDETIPYVYLAMALFDAGAITQQQIYTILERFQTFKDKGSYEHRGTFKILNSDGEFTPETFKILIPAITHSIEEFSERHFQAFKLLVATLPLSEQIFYTSSFGTFNPKSENKSLTRVLFKLKSLYYWNNEFIYLSSGVHDALGITLYGLKEYVRPMLKLGKQSLDDIEEGVRSLSRYSATYYPDSYQYNSVHDYNNITPKEATEHDKYHSQLMCKIPKDILSAFLRMVDISRAVTKLAWSKEIWSWIDMSSEYFFTSEDITANKFYAKYLTYQALFQQQVEKIPAAFDEFLILFEEFLATRNELSNNEREDIVYGAFFAQEINVNPTLSPIYLMKKPDELTSHEMTDLLCRIISFGLGPNEKSGQGFYLFFENEMITALGIVVVLDMIINPTEWKKFHIHPEYLLNDKQNTSCLALHFKLFNEIWPLIKNDTYLIQIFKYHIYVTLYGKIDADNLKEFKNTCELISNSAASISANLGFEKVTQKNSHLKNVILLTYAGSQLNGPAIKTLIENEFSTTQNDYTSRHFVCSP
jgi:hypothetical protein